MHAEKHIKLQKELDSARRKIEEVKSKRKDPLVAPVVSPEPVREIPNSHENSEQGSNAPWGELSDMRAEILEIKNLMSGESFRQQQVERAREKSVTLTKIERKLESLCIAGDVKKRLMAMVDADMNYDQAWSRVSQGISALISASNEDLIDQGGVIALVGPTGSGKTMTIGKMAAQYVIRHGADDIALVTTDRYRIAAHEQLKVFGRILNVPVHVVDESHCLDSILDELCHKKLVLIDTAGLMHTDSCWSEQLQELKMSGHDIQTQLVVSSVGQYQVMCSNYHHYNMVGLSGAIITKIDEAVSLGEVISFLIDTRLQASYFTDGQRVPEDIHLFKQKEMLVRAESLLNSSERWVTISDHDQDAGLNQIFSHSA
jgi:flagellar biosynthesis protein FlhF